MVKTSEEQATRKRCNGDGGATLVEFAIMAPLLFLIIFAIIEFGWAFGQHLDVRHGAREASRLVAVNYGMDDALTGAAQTDAIVAEVCSRMELTNPTTITITYLTTEDVGEFVEVQVDHPLQTITGALDFALASVNLNSTVETRIERGVGSPDPVATFTAVTQQACP